jgi:hypothetical protein
MLIVTKSPGWYEEDMPNWFDAIQATERKGYYVFQGVRPHD